MVLKWNSNGVSRVDVGMRSMRVLVALGASLVLAACGGGPGEPPSAEAEAAVDAAESVEDALAQTDDPFTTEVLNVADGSPTTVEAAVSGDRPVLLWFYAPH